MGKFIIRLFEPQGDEAIYMEAHRLLQNAEKRKAELERIFTEWEFDHYQDGTNYNMPPSNGRLLKEIEDWRKRK